MDEIVMDILCPDGFKTNPCMLLVFQIDQVNEWMAERNLIKDIDYIINLSILNAFIMSITFADEEYRTEFILSHSNILADLVILKKWKRQ